MLAKIIKRAGLGFILGMALGNLIAAAGSNQIVSDTMIQRFGSPASALLVQTLLSGLIGAIAMAGTVLYELDEWPLLRIMAVHFAMIELSFFPIAFYLSWLKNWKEALFMLVIRLIAYLIVFFIMWLRYRLQVKELNKANDKMNNQQNIGGSK